MIPLDKFTKQIFSILLAAYPGHKFKSDDDMGRTVIVWHDMLQDIPEPVLVAAIKKHILVSKSTFFPSVSDIRGQASMIINGDIQSAAEAWGEVTKAIKRWGMYREEEALNSMSDMTQRVVKQIGWKDICTCEAPDVMRGQFARMYEQTTTRVRQDKLLPEGLKDQIKALSEKMGNLLGEGENHDKARIG